MIRMKQAQIRDDVFQIEGRARDRRDAERSLTTRQYARLVSEWIGNVGLDPSLFGTHSLRRTKATVIYRRTGNLRAAAHSLAEQLVKASESTARYLRIEETMLWQ
jgi:integrase